VSLLTTVTSPIGPLDVTALAAKAAQRLNTVA
jgi:hypothetical protein